MEKSKPFPYIEYKGVAHSHLVLSNHHRTKRRNGGGNSHPGAPGEDLVLVAGNLEAGAALLESDDGDVRKPLLPYGCTRVFGEILPFTSSSYTVGSTDTSSSAGGTRTLPFAFRFPKAIIASLSSSYPAANSFQDAAFPAQSSSVAKAETDKSSLPRQPMTPPYNVLITVSTKGIGYALAREFIEVGDNVVICSRSDERAQSAVEALRGEFGGQCVWGTKCDVREGSDVKNLVDYAKEKLNYIHIWINNAGSNAYNYKPLAEVSDEDLIEVVMTNTLGLMLCCREAIKMMLGQTRGGHVFNIDGAGSDGRPTPRFAAYGATKCSVIHLTKSLQAELQMQDVKHVDVHNLSPGMVTTDLLMSGATTKQAKFFINVLAEPAEVVAQYLVPNVRSVPINGSQKPTYIRFLTGIKAYTQILSRISFGARRNRYVLED